MELVLLIVLALIAIAARIGANLWYFHQTPQTTQETSSTPEASSFTDPHEFVSFAEKWTGTNPYGGGKWHQGASTLVGFTSSGEEIEIYQFSAPRHTYLISREGIYVLECYLPKEKHTINSLVYDTSSGGYSSTFQTTLADCPASLAVMNNKAYYTYEVDSLELFERDLTAGGQSRILNISDTLCRTSRLPYMSIHHLHATNDRLLYGCRQGWGNGSGPHLYDMETNTISTLDRDAEVQVVSSHEVLYSTLLWPQWNAEFSSYDTITGQTTQLARLGHSPAYQDYSPYAIGGTIAPLFPGYVFAVHEDDDSDTYFTVGTYYMAEEGSEPYYLSSIKIPTNVPDLASTEWYNMAILPISSTTILANGIFYEYQEDKEDFLPAVVWTNVFTLDGQLVDISRFSFGSPDQVLYVNVQYPR